MNNSIKIGAIALTAMALGACGSSDSDDDEIVLQDAEFEVRVINLTQAQPISPVAIMLHNSGFNSFIDGETASPALELLAEGGDNSDILGEVQAASQHVDSASTAGAVMPFTSSATVSLTVPASELNDLRLSTIGMLILTNDAFTGTNASNISGMSVGDSISINGPTWDSGTESNTETAASIPGLAGEGFNVARDDIIDRVRFHQGVVTSASSDFGLASSSLNETHRFLNPSSRIVVTR
ncbi:MAG: spondin domain-containing protein, partial [Pseudomonadota bacterium]